MDFYSSLKLKFLGIFIIALTLINEGECQNQNSSLGSCSQYFRNARRAGMNMAGRLEIPVDEQFPKFQLRLKFSRSIHHMTVKQLRAKDTGSHTEFLLDPMEQQTNGVLKIDTFLRLRHIFGPAPKLTAILYNNRLLCGDGGFQDDAFIISALSSSTRRSIPVLESTSKNPEKDYEFEVFE